MSSRTFCGSLLLRHIGSNSSFKLPDSERVALEFVRQILVFVLLLLNVDRSQSGSAEGPVERLLTFVLSTVGNPGSMCPGSCSVRPPHHDHGSAGGQYGLRQHAPPFSTIPPPPHPSTDQVPPFHPPNFLNPHDFPQAPRHPILSRRAPIHQPHFPVRHDFPHPHGHAIHLARAPFGTPPLQGSPYLHPPPPPPPPPPPFIGRPSHAISIDIPSEPDHIRLPPHFVPPLPSSLPEPIPPPPPYSPRHSPHPQHIVPPLPSSPPEPIPPPPPYSPRHSPHYVHEDHFAEYYPGQDGGGV